MLHYSGNATIVIVISVFQFEIEKEKKGATHMGEQKRYISGEKKDVDD